ncbi:MAG: DsbA family protein [Chloroflexota bacterium]
MAAVRLPRLKAEYQDKISVSWKGFPLALAPDPTRHFSPRLAAAWQRAHKEEPDAIFQPFTEGQPYPTFSLPALQATKCAEFQGEEASGRFHLAVFKAFFTQSRDISDPAVLTSIAGEVGLDVKQFSLDFERDKPQEMVLAEFEKVKDRYSGWGIPLAIIGDRFPIVGACPLTMYRRAVDLCLADPTA